MSENLVLHMPAPQARRPSPLRTLRWLIALALLSIAGLAVWVYMGRMDVQAEIQGHFEPVSPLMSAKVTEVLASDGQMVKAGQVLAKLDGGAYAQQEAEARALVRGIRGGTGAPGMEETAERVAQAQAAEEFTVRRVALARHEEESRRQALEQSAQVHARAQLRMRDLDTRGGNVTAKARQEAQQGENQARRQWEGARNAHETASRARAAVENELRRVRTEAEHARATGKRVVVPLPAMPQPLGGGNPTELTAPVDGRLLGPLPTVGQWVAFGEPVARLAPAHNANLWAVAHVPRKAVQSLQVGEPALVHPIGQSRVLTAEVEQILPEDGQTPGTVPVRLRLSDADSAALSAQIIARPARVVLWGNSFPGLNKLMPALIVFSF